MDLDDERVLFRRIVVGGEQEPALDVEVFVGPDERFGTALKWLDCVVEMGELSEAGKVTGRLGERRG